MKIGPKYKIARRFGAGIFEKTQGPKFALREERKRKVLKKSRSNFGLQVSEKQKVRFTYSITEKQFSNYVKKALKTDIKNPAQYLYSLLEKRIDSVALRSGLASTRRHARQMASHGHLKLNGRRVNVPSIQVKKDDVVSVKESSQNKTLFSNFEERFNNATVPGWLKVDPKNLSITIVGDPEYKPSELHFDLRSVLQFYKR